MNFSSLLLSSKHYYINPSLPIKLYYLLTLFSYYIHYINASRLWKISIYKNLQDVHSLLHKTSLYKI